MTSLIVEQIKILRHRVDDGDETMRLTQVPFRSLMGHYFT